MSKTKMLSAAKSEKNDERYTRLAVSSNGSFYFPTYDNNGNITKYIDESGNIIASYEYDDFGRLISKSGSMADFFRHRFSTKYYDPETSLYYYCCRFYSPALMRWLNRDPIEEEGGLNLYGFCGNNPMANIDALGQKIIIQVNATPSRRKIIDLKNGKYPRAVTKHFGNCRFSCTKDCKIKVAGHITLWIEMLEEDSGRWLELFPQYIGNVGMSEEESAYQHELDHFKTWKAFYEFLQTANAYDGRHYKDCKSKVQKLNERYASIMRMVSQHSQSFDSSSWNQGGRYESHPLDTSTLKWED